MTLVEFLLARIAEDEAEFQAGEVCPRCDCPVWSPTERPSPDAEAKRQIVSWAQSVAEGNGYDPESAEHVLRILALAFVDHEDYREEWRP